MFVADSEFSSTRAIHQSTNSYLTYTIAGGNGLLAKYLFAFGNKYGRGAKEKYQHPRSVPSDVIRNKLFVTDFYNHRKKVVVSTELAIDFSGAGTPGFQDGSANDAKF